MQCACARSIECKTEKYQHGKLGSGHTHAHIFSNILFFCARSQMKQHQLYSNVDTVRRNETENGNHRRLRNYESQSQSVQTTEFSANRVLITKGPNNNQVEIIFFSRKETFCAQDVRNNDLEVERGLFD